MPNGPSSVSSVSIHWQRASPRSDSYRALRIFTPHLPSLYTLSSNYLSRQERYSRELFSNTPRLLLRDEPWTQDPDRSSQTRTRERLGQQRDFRQWHRDPLAYDGWQWRCSSLRSRGCSSSCSWSIFMTRRPLMIHSGTARGSADTVLIFPWRRTCFLPRSRVQRPPIWPRYVRSDSIHAKGV